MHESRVFHPELHCLQLEEYIKLAKNHFLPNDQKVVQQLYSMVTYEYEAIQKKEAAYSLSQLDFSETDKGKVHSQGETQNMPSWSAFHSNLSTSNLKEQVVGFIPVLPHPSKFGAKLAVLQVRLEQYLGLFGKTTNKTEIINSIEAAERYLVNVNKVGTPCKTMDELHHWIYHQGKM